MPRKRTHSVEQRRRVVQEYLAGETLHGLARRHNLPRNLIRLWVDEHLSPRRGGEPREVSVRSDIAALVHTIQECEARIETIERVVAQRAAELEARRRARPEGREPDDASTRFIGSRHGPPPGWTD